MNPHVADKLLNELTAAEIAYRLKDVPVADFLRQRANKYNGATKKELLRVASLGPDANVWMNYFLDELNG